MTNNKFVWLDKQMCTTNCAKNAHGQCAGAEGKCMCGCHSV